MRVYRPTYRDRGTGKYKKQDKYWLEFRDHRGIGRRLPAHAHQRQSEVFGRHLESLLRCRSAEDRPDAALLQWLETLPAATLAKLESWDLVAPARTSLALPLAEHGADFEQALRAKGRTDQHIRETLSAINEICAACGFVHWRDITASKVDYYLGEQREHRTEGIDGQQTEIKGISARTYNFKLKALKQFCKWMVREGRAIESPVTHLGTLNTQTDRRRVRRALSQEEARALLQATQGSETRFGMTGPERALLYTVAIETGLRASEIRSLKAMSFESAQQTLQVQAGHSKRRRMDTIVLRPETASALQALVCRKTLNAPLFNFPGKDRVIDMLRKDLADAGIPDQDERGKVIDFHSFRHTTGTWLAQAGVHPRVAQEIMRHSDINLTMNTYTHVLREQHVEAVKKLPDLSGTYSRAENMATGTEGRDMFDLLRNLLPPCNEGRISANVGGQKPGLQGRRESSLYWPKPGVSGQKRRKRGNWGTRI